MLIQSAKGETMKSIIRAVKSAPKRAAVLVALVAVVAAPALTFATWGPNSRVTFTQENPADYVTFNSVTNNDKYGDERNFVQVKGPNTGNKYVENATLTDGGKYKVFVFFHNNAAANLNLTAENTRMIADLPATVAKGKTEAIQGVIKADNAKHLDKNGTNLGNEVWDDATIQATDGDYKITVTPNSAKITSQGAVNGQTLSDSLYTEAGAPIGYNALDGKLPGCYEFAGYVVFEFTATKVKEPEVPAKDIEVCRLEDNQIVTIKESEMDTTRYTTDLSKCDETPETPVTPDTPDAPRDEPETPAELPQTGITNFASVLAMAALAGATTYYLRRNA